MSESKHCCCGEIVIGSKAHTWSHGEGFCFYLGDRTWIAIHDAEVRANALNKAAIIAIRELGAEKAAPFVGLLSKLRESES
jgi:hypothetical protein